MEEKYPEKSRDTGFNWKLGITSAQRGRLCKILLVNVLEALKVIYILVQDPVVSPYFLIYLYFICTSKLNHSNSNHKFLKRASKIVDLVENLCQIHTYMNLQIKYVIVADDRCRLNKFVKNCPWFFLSASIFTKPIFYYTNLS